MASFDSDPREFALELVENQIVAADHLLICCLKYMSADEVRDMLDCNELSPRFSEDEDEERPGPSEAPHPAGYDVILRMVVHVIRRR